MDQKFDNSLTVEALLEALDLPALVTDSGGTIRHVNRQAAQCAACPPEELVGQPHAEWEARLRKAFTNPEEGEAPAGEEWKARLETKGVPRRVFERISRPIQGGDGESIGRLEVVRNVTEASRAREETGARVSAERPPPWEAKAEQEMVDLRKRLEQAEKFKLDLTANVTHDLRTPLASIKASVSGLLAGDVAYDEQAFRETLSLIEDETDRLQRRVTNLLSMARMESGDPSLSRDWVDISDVIATALEGLRSIRGERQVVLDFPEDLPLVRADYDQLLIALRNLIENAFLYSPADQPLEISASAGLGQVRVRVRDYGTGLMPDEFEQIFEKFYRGRSARRIPGTGLGLPICRGIAEAHGGRLWAEHAPGGGVAFVLSLPLDPDSDSPDLDTDQHTATQPQPI